MQYILTESEYNELRMQSLKENVKTKQSLQQVCTLAAINTPIKEWGHNGNTTWGCLLAEADDHNEVCDECPVQHQCPNEYKEWSK